jgi:F0F1-type ATP synthase membrane subunit b/b'
MADIYEIQDALEDAVEAVREVKDALEHTQDWLDDAAVGYSRGGFDATSSQRRVKQDRRDRLAIVLEQHEKRQRKLQAEYDAALATLPSDDDNMDDDNE